MFTITRKKTWKKISFHPEGDISLFFDIDRPDEVRLVCMIKSSKLVSVTHDFKARISISSENLAFSIHSLPGSDFRKIGKTIFREDNKMGSENPVIIEGNNAELFHPIEDERIWTYYVDQYLDPILSETSIEYTWDGKFYFKHHSSIDFYEFDIDVEIEFGWLTIVLWKEKEELSLQEILKDKFQIYNIDHPEIRENTITKTYIFPCRL
jgi:hypothetical protein